MPLQMPRKAPARDSRSALEWMRCWEYVSTPWYKDDQRLGHTRDTIPSLIRFGERLCEEFADMGIPLKVEYPDTDTYSLVVRHCILDDDLPELCWTMIATKAAWLAHARGYEFRWSHRKPGQIELDNLEIEIGFHKVELDEDGWPKIVDPRFQQVNHRWVVIEDVDADVTTYHEL